MQILLLSDLHAVDKSFVPKLLPDAPKVEPGTQSWLDYSDPTGGAQPFDALAALLAEADIRPDVVLVAGDICDRANGVALAKAWASLQQLKAACGASYLFATVGNHDVDSRYRGHTYDSVAAVRNLRPYIPLNDKIAETEYWGNGFTVRAAGDARIVCVNSCAYQAGLAGEEKHGRLGERALAGFRDLLAQPSSEKFNVLVCHHQPIPFPLSEEAEDDRMLNGENLLEALDVDDRDWLVVHGHKHIGRLGYGPGSSSSPVILSSGSFAAVLPPRYTTSVGNQIHLVSLEHAPIPTVPFGGVVQSWEYTHNIGWGAVTARDGLPGLCGFGFRGEATLLAQHIAESLAAIGLPATWQQAIAETPELRYLVPADLRQIERILQRERSIGLEIRNGQPAQFARLS